MDQDKPVKILLVLPFFYPHRGGSQKYAEELYAALVRDHPNVSVDVLCYNTDHTRSYEEYRGFRIYRVPCFNVIPARFALPNPVFLVWQLARLSKNKYDFVNTHIRFFDVTWWLWAYAKIIGVQSIFTGHVATHPVHQSKVVETIAKLADLTIASATLNFYDHLTATNKTAIKFFKTKLKVKKDMDLVYGGVDTQYFSPADKTGRSVPKLEIPVPQDKTLITFVGRVIWTKGVTYLYDVAKNLLNSGIKDKLVFVIAGPGELEEDLKKKVTADNLTQNVLLTGNLSYEQVKNLLSVTDIFVNPSHHNEGFPNTVLEAGAAGCYVIATDNAGTWEVVRDGETGRLIPQKDVRSLEDSIKWAVTHPEERKMIAENFRNELKESFDWKVIAKQYYGLLIKWQRTD